MTLRGFHLLFITASTALALGLAAWCLRHGIPLGALGATAVAVLLVVYGVWFRRKARTLVIAGVLWLLAADAAQACEVCFGKASGGMIDGARMGVFLLVGVTVAVQICFVWFFLHLRRRARQAARDSLNLEWNDLQKGPTA